MEKITKTDFVLYSFMDTLSSVCNSMSNELRERLIDHTRVFLDGAADEAQLREDKEIPSLEKYLEIRRKSGVCYGMFDFIEILLGFTLPAEVFEEPNFVKIHDAANDLVCITNVRSS